MKFGRPGRNSNRPTIACNGRLSAAGDPRRVLAGQGARMNMQNAVVLEWTYTPGDFFEEPISIQRNDCSILIEGGRVTATVVPDEYDEGHRKRDELHELVENYFKSVQLFTHRRFSLPKPGMSRVYPDGRRDVTIFVDSCTMKITCGRVDLVTTDPEGKVVRDTKRERIDSEKGLAQSIAQIAPTDPLLAKLLKSFRIAVEDPTDELVHLYEIRDALSSHFGSAKAVRDILGISKYEWDRLGRLACTEPVQQGRHRGEHLVPLRMATDGELDEARGLARRFIEAYLAYAGKALDDSSASR